MKIHVTVTQEKIDAGIHKQICACPLSQSVNQPLTIERYPVISGASVHKADGHCELTEQEEYEFELMDGTKEMRKRDIRKFMRFNLPKIAQDFVTSWDKEKQVGPIEFDLDLVDTGLLLTGQCTMPVLGGIGA